LRKVSASSLLSHALQPRNALELHIPDDVRFERLRVLTSDVLPGLRGPQEIRDKQGRLTGYRAYAPCHRDLTRSLIVSIGQDKPIVWNCFTCRDRLINQAGGDRKRGNDEAQRLTRNELIDAGVPVGALIWSAGEATGFAEKVARMVKDGVSAPWFKLYSVAYLQSYDRLPGGAALERLADEAGVSRSTAFRARAAQASSDYRYLPPAS
jgi:hypothetical protein